MRMRRGIAVAGILGGLLWNATAHAQPPINLLGPTVLSPASGSAIHVTPLPPPTVLSAPQGGPARPPGPAFTTLPMLPAFSGPRYEAALPYLETAQASISGRRYVAAGEALERAETRLLNDGAGTGQGGTSPASSQALLEVTLAREAVAERDQAGALAATGRALAAVREAEREPQGIAMAPAAQPGRIPPSPSRAAAPPEPMITKALLPGHWQPTGWQYRWVAPETQLRPVDSRPWLPGHYVWRDGAWVWDAGHYGED